MVKTYFNRSIWLQPDGSNCVCVVDQRRLPYEVGVINLTTSHEVVAAIREMAVSGPSLIAAAGVYGLYLACLESIHEKNPEEYIHNCYERLLHSRPTEINLSIALKRQKNAIMDITGVADKATIALKAAEEIIEESIDNCRHIGDHGVEVIRRISRRKNKMPVNVLTHDNGGRLACVKWGTAISPIYRAVEEGIDIHVWITETRPRNEGGKIAAWELSQEGISHTVVVDNASGYLMQKNMVDLVIVGAERVTSTGDVAGSIGTYHKALAARDNRVPFYVALPSEGVDWHSTNGLLSIPIEMRSQEEVKYIHYWENGEARKILLTQENTNVLNYAFDITPAKLITSFITEKGIFDVAELDKCRF